MSWRGGSSPSASAMTKKFWNDWQKRVGETKQVYLAYMTFFGKIGNELRYSRKLLTERLDDVGCDKIVSVKFNGDTVHFVINRKTLVTDLASRNGYRYHAENKNISINRRDIISVEFFENKK